VWKQNDGPGYTHYSVEYFRLRKSEMTYMESSGALNSTHSLTHPVVDVDSQTVETDSDTDTQKKRMLVYRVAQKK